MTAISFPNNPSSGDTHTAGNGIVYTYDGEKWTSIGTNSAGTWTRSGTEVSLTNAGDDLNVDSGTLFVDASTDRVGIGTTSPSYQLDVKGADGIAAQRSTDTDRMILSWDRITGYANASGAFNNIIFEQKHNNATAERMRIDGSGRLGIGLTNPSVKLQADGSDVEIRASDNASSKNISLYGGSSSNDPAITFTDALRFYSNSGSAERMRIDSSGRLLVGTSSTAGACSAVFQGRSNTATDGSVIIYSCGTSSPANGLELGELRFSDPDQSKSAAQIGGYRDGGTWSSTSKPGRLVFSTTADGASSPTERMRIGSNGNFDMPGVYNNTTASAANVFVASGGSMARSTSSAKYKTNIETIEDSYSDALLACRPVWYRSTCKADNPNFGYWGFIAEEVATIDPRLVHWKTFEITYDESGSLVKEPCDPEPEGVAYDRFVPHLLNLIKRQKEHIEAMEARLSALEAQ